MAECYKLESHEIYFPLSQYLSNFTSPSNDPIIKTIKGKIQMVYSCKVAVTRAKPYKLLIIL